MSVLISLLRLRAAQALCRMTDHVRGERLGLTVHRCKRCGALYQFSRFYLINVTRVRRGYGPRG